MTEPPQCALGTTQTALGTAQTDLGTSSTPLSSLPPSGSGEKQGNTVSSARDLRTLIKTKKTLSSSKGSQVCMGSNVTIATKKSLKRLQHSTNTSYSEPYLKRARLFVGNVQPSIIGRTDLVNLFSKYGDVLGVSVHNGFAFVQMDQEKAANAAINYTDNSFLKGSRIDVEFSEAARMAGAKFKKLNLSPQGECRSVPAFYTVSEEQVMKEKEHELRIARILQMEREIAMLRSMQTSDEVRLGLADNQRGSTGPVHCYGENRAHQNQDQPQHLSPPNSQFNPSWAGNQWRPRPPSYDERREKRHSPPWGSHDQQAPHPSCYCSQKEKQPVQFNSPPLPTDPYKRWHRESPRYLHHDGEGPLVQVFLPQP